MKKCLGNLPTLTAPLPKEPLTLYLSVTDKAIGAVLMVDRKGVQTPIYYVSRMLLDAETRYSTMEKLVLALIHASRRLRRYFQGHPINVLTDFRINDILRKPELSGRLAKWAIELGEHSISYKARPSFKGQVLADFITEVPADKVEECANETSSNSITPDDTQIWKLYTDGACNDEGAGAGLRLITPEGKEYTYAIRLDFQTTNNEAEYEALIAGLRIAKKMGAQHIEAHVDSMLVANHIDGTYEAREPTIVLYIQHTKELMNDFSYCKVSHVRRSQNKPADALSKMASTAFDHMEKDIRVETLAKPSVPSKQVNVVQTGKNPGSPQ